jgi:hypothetical protein
MFNILKWLGVLPAADGLAGHLFDLEFMKQLDLLHGFGGATPHILGIICFSFARYLAAGQNKLLSPADADRSRMTWFRRAFSLLLFFLLWTYFPLPEDFSRPLIEWRWRLAAALYVLFYVALGKSEPQF